MNKLIKLTSLGFVAVALVMNSCSDDNDEPENKPATGPSVDNVFTAGLPASVDGATFTTNGKGQVTKIVDGSEVVTFEYGKFSRATEYDAKMTVTDNDYPEDGCEFYMQLNAQGFVTYALQVYNDPTDGENGDGTDTWEFQYNADGQLTSMKRSESSDSYSISYANGNITKVIQSEGDGDRSEYNFSYTNDEFKSSVDNKGNIMLFDSSFHVDMDEMEVAYYAGLLGKSTKNLPMGYTMTGKEGGSSYDDSEVYHWEFNSNNLPTKFWEGDYEYDATSFSWK